MLDISWILLAQLDDSRVTPVRYRLIFRPNFNLAAKILLFWPFRHLHLHSASSYLRYSFFKPSIITPRLRCTSTKMADTTSAPKEAPWHAAFPTAKSSPDSVSKEELLAWLQEGKEGGKDFVLVDLRRTDYEGGTIRGSINLPAQSLYPTIPYLYNLFKAAGTTKVMWYCGKFTFDYLSFRNPQSAS